MPSAYARTARPFLHPLAGSLPIGLLRSLHSHGGFARRYSAQVAFMFLGGVLRWPFCFAERLRTDRRAAAAAFDPPPVFIIGHWRSGTTHLHNLLSRDEAFCFPTILDALRPYEFYPSPFEFISRALLLRSLPATRPMDDLPLQALLPQEDEIALAAMGAPSFFNCLYFPGMMGEIFTREVLFQNPHPGAVEHWATSLRYYLGKLAALHPDRRLLLKNPAHSARIAQLRALFPGAKFIHIHRDPIEVVQSTRKLYRSLLPLVALQNYDPIAVDRHIAWAYPALMGRLLAGVADLPAADLAQVKHAELARNPVGVLENVYSRLALPGFDRARSAIADYARDHGRESSSTMTADPDRSAADAERLAPFRARLGYSGNTVG